MLTTTKTTTPQEEVAKLSGTLTGAVTGTMADISALATSGGNTYTDAAVNAKITAINLQLKELQTKVNELIQALADMGNTKLP